MYLLNILLSKNELIFINPNFMKKPCKNKINSTTERLNKKVPLDTVRTPRINIFLSNPRNIKTFEG